MSVGVIKSIVSANSTLGADNETECPASRSRVQLLNKNAYHTKPYTFNRYFCNTAQGKGTPSFKFTDHFKVLEEKCPLLVEVISAVAGPRPNLEFWQ